MLHLKSKPRPGTISFRFIFDKVFCDLVLNSCNLQVGGDLEVSKSATSSRSNDLSLQDFIENYIKSNDISFKLPIVGSTVTLAGRNLDNEELGIKLNFGSGSEVQGFIFQQYAFSIMKNLILQLVRSQRSRKSSFRS